MRFIIFFTALSAALASEITFENLDIEKLLQNKQQIQAAFACVLDEGPCGEMQGLRDDIPELIKTNCHKCSPKMNEKYNHLKQVLFEKYPDKFNALMVKYSTPKQ